MPAPAETGTLFERFSDNAHHIVAGTLFTATGSIALSAVAAADHMVTHVLDLASQTSFCATLATSVAYGAYTGLQVHKKNLNKTTGLSKGFCWKKETLLRLGKIIDWSYEAPHIDFTIPATVQAFCMGALLTANTYIAEKVFTNKDDQKKTTQQHKSTKTTPRPFAFVPH